MIKRFEKERNRGGIKRGVPLLFKMEQLKGSSGAVTVRGTPLAVAPPFAITVSRAIKATFTDHGTNHSWEGGNGLSSPFVYMDGGAKQTAIEV